MNRRKLIGAVAVVSAVAVGGVMARPQPQDVFREYPKQTGMLRIGERWEWGGSNSGKNMPLASRNGAPSYQVDLEGAIRAEVVVSYDQCHGSTEGLRIAFNDNEYVRLPVPEAIPEPQPRYMFWIYPTVEVPLAHLREGANKFRMRVDADPRPEGEGGWMQNLVYAVVLRVYYGPSKPHSTGEITSPADGESIGDSAVLTVRTDGKVKQVDFVGLYEDHDYEGNGIYRQWHYTYDNKARIADHLGTTSASPYSVRWNTHWVPDQPQPMEIAARIVDTSNMIYMTPAVKKLTLYRPGVSVELCKPYNIPDTWVTRKGLKQANFRVSGDLSKAKAAVVKCRVWKYEGNCAWLVNGETVGTLTTVSGEVTTNSLPLELLKSGENVVATPKYGHHGIELCFPGLVPLVRYEGVRVGTRRGSRAERGSARVETIPSRHGPATLLDVAGRTVKDDARAVSVHPGGYCVIQRPLGKRHASFGILHPEQSNPRFIWAAIGH